MAPIIHHRPNTSQQPKMRLFFCPVLGHCKLSWPFGQTFCGASSWQSCCWNADSNKFELRQSKSNRCVCVFCLRHVLAPSGVWWYIYIIICNLIIYIYVFLLLQSQALCQFQNIRGRPWHLTKGRHGILSCCQRSWVCLKIGLPVCPKSP